MKASAVGSAVLALALSDLAQATRFSLYKPRSHARRDQLTAPANSSATTQPVALNDVNDLRYLANITIGSEQKTVTIDTGSTDLVIFSTIAGAVDTGVPGSVEYAAGTASGNVFSATVEFAGQEIHHQAFLSTNVVDESFGDGIMGIALFTESSIELALNSSPGAAPFLDNVFATDPSTSNFVSFLLQREDDPDQDINAEFTIGEIVPGYENVSSMPQIPVQSAAESGHWQIFIDSVLGPDDQPINFTTSVQGSPQPIGILDTGAPLALVPKAVSDAIYSNIPGAVLDSTVLGGSQDAYIVDCTSEAKASFVINGTTYPIHPLDLVVPLPLGNGTTICIGAFVPDELSSDFSFFDFLLGDPFVRNVYMVLNYGDFVASDTTQTKDAYVQLLSTTDLTVAHKEFTDARPSGGTPFTGGNNSSSGGLPSGGNNNNNSPPPSKDVTLDQVKTNVETEAQKVKHIAIIVAASVGGAVLLGIALCLVCCCGLCGFRKRNMRSFGMRGADATREVYRPLHAPVPQSHQEEYGYEGKGQLY